MIDLRTLDPVPEHVLRNAETWRGIPFVWKRWTRPHEKWTHDHCPGCQACICDHRDRDPDDKPGLVDGGHYRYAFYAEDSGGGYIWVCRNCFEKLQPIAGWIRRGNESRR